MTGVCGMRNGAGTPLTSSGGASRCGLVRIIKRKLKKIQYRPRLINGYLAAAGLRTGSWSSQHYECLPRFPGVLFVAVAAAGRLLPERFSRCCPQPGYRSGDDQG